MPARTWTASTHSSPRSTPRLRRSLVASRGRPRAVAARVPRHRLPHRARSAGRDSPADVLDDGELELRSAAAYGNTRFVAIDGGSGQAGELGDTTPPDTAGPSVDALRFLDETLAAMSEPHRVVLTHAPPHLDGHYAPQPECGFRQGEPEFLDIIRRHDVKLVCCATVWASIITSATASASS